MPSNCFIGALMVLATLCAGLSDLNAAPLASETPKQRLQSLAGTSTGVIEFDLHNTSESSVTIDRVEGDCSCLSFSYEAAPIRPREHRKLIVAVDLRPKVGLTTRKISVYSRDVPVLILELEVEVLAGAVAVPASLAWKANEMGSKTIVLSSKRQLPEFAASVVNKVEGYFVELLREGDAYHVTVTKVAGDVPRLSLLRISARHGNAEVDEVIVPLLAR